VGGVRAIKTATVAEWTAGRGRGEKGEKLREKGREAERARTRDNSSALFAGPQRVDPNLRPAFGPELWPLLRCLPYGALVGYPASIRSWTEEDGGVSVREEEASLITARAIVASFFIRDVSSTRTRSCHRSPLPISPRLARLFPGTRHPRAIRRTEEERRRLDRPRGKQRDCRRAID